MDFTKNNILSSEQFNRSSIEKVMSVADDFYDLVTEKKKSDLLKGKIMASLFYEPSTRTRLSFETAMLRLSGDVITVDGISNSSLVKGESLFDTAGTIEQFADVIVVRHPEKGSATLMSEGCGIPVINAGDGANQHPTQALLDMYTLKKAFKKIDGLRIVMAGDLKYGRTVHSLFGLLKHYDVEMTFAAPDELQMPDDYYKDIKGDKTSDLAEAAKNADVIYMTRIQRERFSSEAEYKKYKGVYVINRSFIERVNPKVKVMHPLPRVDEVSSDVDDMENALYFRQTQNGVCIRMALLTLVLGKA